MGFIKGFLKPHLREYKDYEKLDAELYFHTGEGHTWKYIHTQLYKISVHLYLSSMGEELEHTDKRE